LPLKEWLKRSEAEKRAEDGLNRFQSHFQEMENLLWLGRGSEEATKALLIEYEQTLASIEDMLWLGHNGKDAGIEYLSDYLFRYEQNLSSILQMLDR
jgi:hypothetical protein